MDQAEIDGMLAATLEDHRLSRGERHALREVVADQRLDPAGYAFWRHRTFALAKQEITGEENRKVLEWLEGVVKLLHPEERATGGIARVCFSPGSACLRAILEQLESAKKTVEVCVFTITDDRLAEGMLAAHKRGVTLRVITDDEKSFDKGSDVHRLADAGIEVRIDQSEHHMHHKFAIFDGGALVTGSYNWTRSAAEHNQENVLVTDDDRLVRPYVDMFTRFWDQLRPR